jgi:hypothetical protein
LPVNSPGFDVAAIAGVPWFTEARSALLVLVAVWCCVCAAVAGVCGSLSAACSCGVACADVPPVPLQPLYEQLCRQAVLSVKAEHVATFLGHKITPNLAQEIGSQFSTRIAGTCVKHRFGKSTVSPIWDICG